MENYVTTVREIVKEGHYSKSRITPTCLTHTIYHVG